MRVQKDDYIAQGRTASIYIWDDTRVIKLFSMYFREDAGKEHIATRIAYNAGLPVPEVHGVIEVDGQQGIIMEHIRGPLMADVFISRPWKMPEFAKEMAELNVKVHRCTTRGLPSLKDRLESRIYKSSEIPSDIKEPVLKILLDLPSGEAICHGDFHPRNIIMTKDKDSPVIIDWVDATRGDPVADVARTWLLLKMAPYAFGRKVRWFIRFAESILWSNYIKRYRQLRDISVEELTLWQIPVMTARLAEGIQIERKVLLSMIERRLRQYA